MKIKNNFGVIREDAPDSFILDWDHFTKDEAMKRIVDLISWNLEHYGKEVSNITWFIGKHHMDWGIEFTLLGDKVRYGYAKMPDGQQKNSKL